MRVKTDMILTGDEINLNIPYPVICEMRYGAKLDSRKRKQLWDILFTEDEQERAEKLFRLARRWYLKTGVPEEYAFESAELILWLKLGEFCGNL